MYLIFETGMLLAMTGLIVSFCHGLLLGSIVWKAAASGFFVLAGICGVYYRKKNGKFSGTMLSAFICSMAGDVLLALDRNQGMMFVLGVASFAAAHILFTIAFSSVSAFSKIDFAGISVVFVGLVLLLLLGNFEYHGLLPVLLGYSVVISVMSVKALSLWRCRQIGRLAAVLVMLGGTLFLLSDIVLLFWLFGAEMPKIVQVINWILYYLAQGCLSSVLSLDDFDLH